MKLLFESPSLALADYVNAYVFYRHEQESHNNVLPLGSQFLWAVIEGGICVQDKPDCNVIIDKVCLVGFSTQPFTARQISSTYVAAVNFKALGAFTIFGIDMSRYRNGFCELKDSLFHIEELLSALRSTNSHLEMKNILDVWLIQRLRQNKQDMGLMKPIIKHIEGRHYFISVEEILDKFSLTERTLERWFNKMIGVNPKLYLRIHRFNQVLRKLEHADSTMPQLLEEAGYFDQSHFIKDFLSFTHCKPSAFKKLKENDLSRETITGLLKVLS